MTQALHAGADPGQLVPGDVPALLALALAMDGVADGAQHVTGLLARADTGDWRGRAAEAYGAAVRELPAPYDTAAWCFSASGRAVRRYADAVELARADVGRAVQQCQEADLVTDRWLRSRADPLVPLPGLALGSGRQVGSAPSALVADAEDPGRGLREQAHRRYDDAQADLALEAERTAGVLLQAAAEAPVDRGFAHQVARFGHGVADALTASAKLAWSFTPHALVLQPRETMRARQEAVAGVKQTVLHPRETVDAYLQQWEDDPAYAAGQALPDVVLEVLSGGAGLAAVAARRATTVPARAVDGAEHVDGPEPVDVPVAPSAFARRESAKIALHAFNKHRHKFPDLTSVGQFRDYISGVIMRPSESFEIPGRRLYWDDERKVIVIQQDDHSGTAFVPKNGKARYDSEVARARAQSSEATP